MRPAELDTDVSALDVTGFAQACPECSHEMGTRLRRAGIEKAQHRHCRLLRPCRDRPCRRRPAEQRDELAPLHSITSSARARSVVGTSSPSALAVLRLITSSNLVGCWTGSSAGFSPRRMRSIYETARLYRSITSGP